MLYTVVYCTVYCTVYFFVVANKLELILPSSLFVQMIKLSCKTYKQLTVLYPFPLIKKRTVDCR